MDGIFAILDGNYWIVDRDGISQVTEVKHR